MQGWAVTVLFGSLQQNRCLGINLNPVYRKTGMASQPEAEKVLCRKPGHTFQISHPLNKANYHVHLKLLASWSTLEDCSARQLVHHPQTEISQHLLAPLPGYVSAHMRAPQKMSPYWVAWSAFCSFATERSFIQYFAKLLIRGGGKMNTA